MTCRKQSFPRSSHGTYLMLRVLAIDGEFRGGCLPNSRGPAAFPQRSTSCILGASICTDAYQKGVRVKGCMR